MPKFQLSNAELASAVSGKSPEFPKYTTQRLSENPPWVALRPYPVIPAKAGIQWAGPEPKGRHEGFSDGFSDNEPRQSECAGYKAQGRRTDDRTIPRIRGEVL